MLLLKTFVIIFLNAVIIVIFTHRNIFQEKRKTIVAATAAKFFNEITYINKYTQILYFVEIQQRDIIFILAD